MVKAETSHYYPQIGRVYFHPGSKADVSFSYREIFKHREYLRNGIKLHPENTVFDVGANIGMFSLLADQICASNLSLFAFEPIPTTYNYLVRNLDEHGMLGRSNVHVLNAGLTHCNGPRTAQFTHYKHSPTNSTMKQSDKNFDIITLKRWLDDPAYFFGEIRKRRGNLFPVFWAIYGLLYPIARPILRRYLDRILEPTTVTCQLLTLSEIVSKFNVARIDLLKIDVEGAELDVLQGIVVEDWPKIGQVVLEVHDIDGRLDTVSMLLREKGFNEIIIERGTFFKRLGLSVSTVYARHPF